MRKPAGRQVPQIASRVWLSMVDDVVFSKLPPLLFQVDAIEEKAKVEIGYVYLSFCGLGLWVCFFFF